MTQLLAVGIKMVSVNLIFKVSEYLRLPADKCRTAACWKLHPYLFVINAGHSRLRTHVRMRRFFVAGV